MTALSRRDGNVILDATRSQRVHDAADHHSIEPAVDNGLESEINAIADSVPGTVATMTQATIRHYHATKTASYIWFISKELQ
jgi:hypothetical protein